MNNWPRMHIRFFCLVVIILMYQKKIFSLTKNFDCLQGVPKKGIDKKLSVGVARDFNPQILNLFGFGISVSFVWCII